MKCESINVMVVDDHPMMRAGLTSEINSQPDMRVICEASDGFECIEKFRKHRPDVTLLDLRMPHMHGLEALTAIRGEFSNAKIVILSTVIGDVQVYHAFRAGAMGYVPKSALRVDLIDTIRTIAEGHHKVPPEIAAVMAAHAGQEDLTERELLVLRAVAKGCSNKIIASELGISEHTIKNHVQNILEKLGASDRTHAVTIALQRGFFEL